MGFEDAGKNHSYLKEFGTTQKGLIMSAQLVLRVGTPADIEPVMQMAQEACDEQAIFPSSIKKIQEVNVPALRCENGIVGILSTKEGEVVGATVLRVVEVWYSEQKVLEEAFIFIKPEYRSSKGGWARKMCEFSKKLSDDLGIPLIAGIVSNVRTEAKIRLYERQFGKPNGAFFYYNAQAGVDQRNV
jgi:predicted N-acetyltransferase YhbS